MYLQDVARYRTTLGLLYAIRENNKTGDPERVVEEHKAAATIGELVQTCRERGYETLEIENLNAEWSYPKVACALARDATQLLDRYLDGTAAAFVASKVDRYGRSLARLAKGEWIEEDDLNALKAWPPVLKRWADKLEPVFTVRSKQAPADLFAKLTPLGGELAAATQESVKRARVPKAVPDAAVKRAVTALLGAAKYQHVNAKVVAANATSKDWTISKHRNHIPAFRSKSAFGVIRATGESFCRLYPLTARQDYQGGGRYNTATTAFVTTGPTVVACP